MPAPAPGEAIYTSPGATPAVVVPANVPANGDVHFPRGTSLPQSNNQTPSPGTLQWASTDMPRSSSPTNAAMEQPVDGGATVAASNPQWKCFLDAQVPQQPVKLSQTWYRLRMTKRVLGPLLSPRAKIGAITGCARVNHEPPIRIVEPSTSCSLTGQAAKALFKLSPCKHRDQKRGLHRMVRLRRNCQS